MFTTTTTTTKTKDETSITSSHYSNHTADSYESSFFYSSHSAYVDDLAHKVAVRLGLQSHTAARMQSPVITDSITLLDVGGGTGNFTQQVMAKSNHHHVKAIVLDPFLTPNDTPDRHGHPDLTFVAASAQQVFERKQQQRASITNFHKVLLKEVIHHVNDNERVDILKGVHQHLSTCHATDSINDDQNKSSPSLLIVTRPQRNIDYPLWDEALEVWAANQPSATQLTSDLQAAGFVHVETSIEEYPCSIPLTQWQNMIQQRFWSTFAHFTDDELQSACHEIEKRYQADATSNRDNDEKAKILLFRDRLVFLSAHHS